MRVHFNEKLLSAALNASMQPNSKLHLNVVGKAHYVAVMAAPDTAVGNAPGFHFTPWTRISRVSKEAKVQTLHGYSAKINFVFSSLHTHLHSISKSSSMSQQKQLFFAALCVLITGGPTTGQWVASSEESVSFSKEKSSSSHSVASEPMPWARIGDMATAGYTGDAIGISPSQTGAFLRAGFQKLAGTVSQDGLTLISTSGKGDTLQLRSSAFGRSGSIVALPTSGTVVVDEKLVTFGRTGLVEEYSVSADGVRQDFIIAERPSGAGDLMVELELCGAQAAAAADGVLLTMGETGRKLVYNRVRVTDAMGQELVASLDVRFPSCLVMRVADEEAVYPVRIDPTFSDANWVSLNPGLPGTSGWVKAAIVDQNDDLYVGGWFSIAGTVAANNIAKWDGSTWSAVGDGTNDEVLALAHSGNDIYAGGRFTSAGGVLSNYIAKWDGSNWSALGSGLNELITNNVSALAVSGSDLYVGGRFTNAGGFAANNVAKWNGSTWSALGSGVNDPVAAIAVDGPNVYVGGSFTTAGGNLVNHIAKWNGSTWTPLGVGVGSLNNVVVNDIVVSGTDVYAGGNFTTAGGIAANNIAKWNGSSWSALGEGTNYIVYALAMRGTDLYVGGDFYPSGGVANSISRWDGIGWSPVGTGSNPTVYTLAWSSTDFFAGGGGPFTLLGGGVAENIAKLDGSNWSVLGTGIDDAIESITVSGSILYAGGLFTTAGGLSAKHIAMWNGSSWSALGSGMTGWGGCSVRAMAVIGTDLYAGGYFTTAGGLPCNGIAKWDGNSWSALGTGTDYGGSVNALVVIGTDLYACGNFASMDGVTVNNIAKWDGSSWSALGSGLGFSSTFGGGVGGMAVIGSDLYVGGFFVSAGGLPVNNIAKWDGTSWSALGVGTNNSIGELAVSGTDLYVTGGFTTAGGVAANRIAKWDGSSWSNLGAGVDLFVYAIVANGSDIYVGGNFDYAGGLVARRIAKWDGNNWSALGSGMSGDVRALAIDSDGQLIVGGSFGYAGSTLSPYIVKGLIGPDSDGDGIVDTLDDCPKVAGQIGSGCDDGDPNTTNDVIGADCLCSGLITGVVDHSTATTTITYYQDLRTITVIQSTAGFVEVLDVTGRILQKGIGRMVQFDLNGLPTAVYIVRGEDFVRRLVVE